MNTEIIKNFVGTTVFKSKKVDPGIFTALSHAAGEKEDNTGFLAVEELKTMLLDDPAGIYKTLLPVKYSYGRKTPFELLPEFTADKNEARKHLHCMYLDKENNTAVTTDGRYLAFCDIPADIAAGLEKSYIRQADGSEFDGQFPNYKMVIPANCREKVQLSNIHLYAGMCKAIINFESCILGRKYDTEYTAVGIGDCRFSVLRLEKVFNAFSQAGDEDVTMEYNTPDLPVLFIGKSGLNIVLMPLRSVKSTYIIDICSIVNILTDEYGSSCKRLFDRYKKIDIGGNSFYGTSDNPLAEAEIEISQSEVNHLDDNIRMEYKGICSHIGAAACGACNFDPDRIKKPLKETSFSLASSKTSELHGEFVKLVKSIKDNVTAFAVMPLLLTWMENINAYVDSLIAAGYKSSYRDKGIVKMPIEQFEDSIFGLLQRNIRECRMTEEKAAMIFPGELDQYNSIADRLANKEAEKDRQRQEMENQIPDDGGIYIEECFGELWFRHEKCGHEIYKSLEDIQAELCRIEKNEHIDRLRVEKEKADNREKRENNCCSCIVLDSGIKQSSGDNENNQDSAAASGNQPDAVNYTPEESNTAGVPENKEKQDAELDNLPYWDKARSLCNVSSGTLAVLLNCDKYSVIDRVEYEWQGYIARYGTETKNWHECWQEFQQSEEYNYLALLYGLPVSGHNNGIAADNQDDVPENIHIDSEKFKLRKDKHGNFTVSMPDIFSPVPGAKKIYPFKNYGINYLIERVEADIKALEKLIVEIEQEKFSNWQRDSALMRNEKNLHIELRDFLRKRYIRLAG